MKDIQITQENKKTTENVSRIDIDKKQANYIKKFAFIPKLVRISENTHRYIWFKSYFEKYEFVKCENFRMDMFGHIRILDEVEWIHTENIEYVRLT